MANTSLPVYSFKDKILSAVKENPVVVITAETGAGKSTQVPQYLLEAGYNIVVTQPRRIAAITLAERVAEEYGCALGGIVGYRTAHERCDSRRTSCLFVTDGLAMVRELLGVGQHNVLVIDEVHEWNLNIEVLVAWAKRQIESGANFKVVIMSATMEAEKLAEYYNGAAILSIPGRLFPVKKQKAGFDILSDVITLLHAGRNVLVFLPGKEDIIKLISELEEIPGLGAKILPLHGDLSSQEQKACFRVKGKFCVVSTNIAQTSVTIPNIDGVVDSGMEKRIELVNGVEGLYLRPISWADAEQRGGRGGRVREGISIDHCPTHERLQFPVAEILRVRLDQMVLRLAGVGIDAEMLDFFHQPNKAEIHDAKRALKALGCMDESGMVTSIGYRVAKFPISVEYGRMIIEAENRGVVNDVIDIAALLEQGEITVRRTKDKRPGMLLWGSLCSGENESDVMAQLAIFRKAFYMNRAQMFEHGIMIKAFNQAEEKRKRLAESLVGKIENFASTGNREDILKSVCAGMVDHLYRQVEGYYVNGDDTRRELNDSTVVYPTEWIVGKPFDVPKQTKYGPIVKHVVTRVTKVKPEWLAEVAPQLVQIEKGLDPCYDENRDVCISTAKTRFNGQEVGEEQAETPNHPEANKLLVSWLALEMRI